MTRSAATMTAPSAPSGLRRAKRAQARSACAPATDRARSTAGFARDTPSGNSTRVLTRAIVARARSSFDVKLRAPEGAAPAPGPAPSRLLQRFLQLARVLQVRRGNAAHAGQEALELTVLRFRDERVVECLHHRVVIHDLIVDVGLVEGGAVQRGELRARVLTAFHERLAGVVRLWRHLELADEIGCRLDGASVIGDHRLRELLDLAVSRLRERELARVDVDLVGRDGDRRDLGVVDLRLGRDGHRAGSHKRDPECEHPYRGFHGVPPPQLSALGARGDGSLHLTTIAPFMIGWNVHVYEVRPRSRATSDHSLAGLTLPESNCRASPVTVWGTMSRFTHTIVSPAATVTSAGAYVMPLISTRCTWAAVF